MIDYSTLLLDSYIVYTLILFIGSFDFTIYYFAVYAHWRIFHKLRLRF